MAMNIIGSLPTILERRKDILVFSNHLTKFAETVPIKDQKATTVARNFVEKVVLRHGVPKQLLTDLGSNFTSKVMTAVYDLLRMKKLQTTPYHQEEKEGGG